MLIENFTKGWTVHQFRKQFHFGEYTIHSIVSECYLLFNRICSIRICWSVPLVSFRIKLFVKNSAFFYLFLDQKNICFTKLFTKTRNAVTLRLRKVIQNWKCKYIKWNRLFLVPLVSWQGCINNPSLLLSPSKTNGRGWWGRCERKFVYSTWSEREIQDGGGGVGTMWTEVCIARGRR